MNRVSIVVPVYNSSRFLDECIISDILLYGNNNINEIECRYVQNYVEYAKELFTVDMKYKEKRRIFFKVGVRQFILFT